MLEYYEHPLKVSEYRFYENLTLFITPGYSRLYLVQDSAILFPECITSAAGNNVNKNKNSELCNSSWFTNLFS
jgi:hypothetical protein